MKTLKNYIKEALINKDTKLEEHIILDKYQKIKSIEVAMDFSHLQNVIDHKMILDKIAKYSSQIPVYTTNDTYYIDLKFDNYKKYSSFYDKETEKLKNVAILLLCAEEECIKNNKATRNFLQPYFKNEIKKVEWFENMHSISLCIYLKDEHTQFLQARYAVRFALKIKIDKH